MAEAATLVGGRMSFEAYLELPAESRAEYVEGLAVVNPAPTFRHQKICTRLTFLLTAALGHRAEVAVAVGWRLPAPANVVRIPGLMVLAAEPAGDLVTEVPAVVVEVLSANRSDDLVRKATEYLRAGVGQYWTVDPRDQLIEVFANTPSGWELLTRLTRDGPTGTVTVADLGEVTLSLEHVLG